MHACDMLPHRSADFLFQMSGYLDVPYNVPDKRDKGDKLCPMENSGNYGWAKSSRVQLTSELVGNCELMADDGATH